MGVTDDSERIHVSGETSLEFQKEWRSEPRNMEMGVQTKLCVWPLGAVKRRGKAIARGTEDG